MSHMQFDEQKIEDAVLALLSVFASAQGQVWKKYDFAVMDALFEKGLISDPKTRAQSIVLTAVGEERGRQLAVQLFSPDV